MQPHRFQIRYPLGFRLADRCRRCGCTDRRACRPIGGCTCWWANAHHTLCSRCVGRPGRRRYRWGRLGHTRARQIRQWYAERAALQTRAAWLRWEARHAGDDRRDLLLTLAAAAERAADGGGPRPPLS